MDNVTNLAQVESLPVVVNWGVGNETCEEARKTSSTYACGGNTRCYADDRALVHRRRCEEGYEGNAYLPNGCQGKLQYY